MGIKRWGEGDLIGGALEFVSGLASIFPGIGTGISAGIDLGLAFSDAKGLTGSKSIKTTPVEEDTKLATGGIVTKPTKALVGEAGAEAVVPLNEFYAKMDELISAVKAGGDVYMDGNKVGQSLVLSTYKST